MQGDENRLCVYGEAFHALSNAKVIAHTTEVRFMFESCERIAAAVASAGNFEGWPRLRAITLKQNGIEALPQLLWLANLVPQVAEVS